MKITSSNVIRAAIVALTLYAAFAAAYAEQIYQLPSGAIIVIL